MAEMYDSTPGVSFTFTETEPDGGGELQIVATTEARKEDLCDLYRRDFPAKTKYAPLADESSPMAHTIKPYDHVQASYGRVACYRVPVTLENRWFEPYTKCLERITGYAGPIGDFLIPDPRPLCATHHRTDWRIEDGQIQAIVFYTAHAWVGKTASERAHRMAETCLQADVGEVPLTPEFIQSRNGQYVHNPEYGRGPKPPEPKLCNEALWDALFAWWRRTHATPAQLDILARCEKLHNTEAEHWRRMPWQIRYGQGVEYTLYVLDPEGTCNYDGKGLMVRVMKWEEFAALGAPREEVKP